MATTGATPVLPTYISTNRFSSITDTNGAGSIWIVTLICLIYSSLVLIVRGYLRWKMYGLDDYLALLATAFQTAEVVAILLALSHGLGSTHQSMTSNDLAKANQATFAGIIFFIAASCIAKCSIICLMMRLFNLRGSRSNTDTKGRVLRCSCYTVLIMSILWGIGSVIGLSANCSVPSFMTARQSTTCPGQALRWGVIIAFDTLAELSIFVLSVIIVIPVQLRLSMKFPIVLAFSGRLPCAILSIIRAVYTQKYTMSVDPGLSIVPVMVIMQTELCWSMISITIPNLKSFVRSFNSGFGLGLDLDLVSRYGSSGPRSDGRRKSDYELSAIRSSASASISTPGLKPGQTKRHSLKILRSSSHLEEQRSAKEFVTNPRSGSSVKNYNNMSNGSVINAGSQEHIIRKDIGWEVRYEQD